LFDLLDEDQKERVIAALVTHNFQAGTKIIKEDDPGDLLYMIKEGRVKFSKGNQSGSGERAEGLKRG